MTTKAIVILTLPNGNTYSFGVDHATFVVGRRGTCELALPAPGISAEHVQFALDEWGGTVRVTDLGSRNGTRINGEQLVPHEGVVVPQGTPIEVTNFTLAVQAVDPNDESASLSLSTSHSLSRSLLSGLMGSAVRQSRAWLEVIEGPFAGLRYDIAESVERLTLGVAGEAQLDLAEPALAGRPLLILLDGPSYRLAPPAGIPVRINGRSLATPEILRSGDRIGVCRSILGFHDPMQDAIEALDDEGSQTVPPSTAIYESQPAPSAPSAPIVVSAAPSLAKSRSLNIFSRHWSTSELTLLLVAGAAFVIAIFFLMVIFGAF